MPYSYQEFAIVNPTRQKGCEAKCVYESGPTGFGLDDGVGRGMPPPYRLIFSADFEDSTWFFLL